VSVRLRLVGLILLLGAVLLLLLTGYMRSLLAVPLFRAYGIARLLFESIPQLVTWTALLVLALPLAWRSLHPRLPTRQREDEAPAPVGPVGYWLMAIRSARRVEYQRWELAQELRQLVMKMLAEQAQLTEQQVWRRLDSGALAIPPDVLAFLRRRRPFGKRLGIFARRAEARAFDHEMAEVTRYLRDKRKEMEGMA
jgi:membrane protein implicated in regulation of membrane protease activity